MSQRARDRRVDRWYVVLAVVVVLALAVPIVVLRWSAAPAGPDPAGTAGSCAGHPLSASRELRGMWITTVNNTDWPSRPGLSEERAKAEYRSWLDLAQRLRFNAVFVHVRPSGDAFWPSTYAPWSHWLTGQLDGRAPGWDPLAFMVAETHARNLEFHAWFNPYKATSAGPTGAGADVTRLPPTHPLRQHPQWAVAYPKKTDGGQFYYDPGIPEARRFVEDSILDAVNRYDIDGVHFDDFFYPYRAGGQDFGDDASFARYGKGFAGRAEWRRDNVNRFVREMNERIKAAKPWVKFGISPFGIWRNKSSDSRGSATRGLQSYDDIYADTRLWVKSNWIDYVAPQLYWHIGFDIADYAKLLPWWVDTVAETRVQLYIGQADYRIGQSGAWRNPTQLDRQLALNRKYGVAGSVHFTAKNIRADRQKAVTRYVAAHHSAPALLPAMTHLPTRPPAAPVIRGIAPAGGSGKGTAHPAPATGPGPASNPAHTSGATPSASGAAIKTNGTTPSASARAVTDTAGEIGAPAHTGTARDSRATITWRAGRGATATSFAIYRADLAVDKAKATLMATARHTGATWYTWTDRSASAGRRYVYCVTALDRTGTESEASAPGWAG